MLTPKAAELLKALEKEIDRQKDAGELTLRKRNHAINWIAALQDFLDQP